ncbi:hypothetical protein AJ87_13800 [Rhizobium yanglingense]|nr:hypothetical protein AJ87_13800 [Rhizobium yanglingense]
MQHLGGGTLEVAAIGAEIEEVDPAAACNEVFRRNTQNVRSASLESLMMPSWTIVRPCGMARVASRISSPRCSRAARASWISFSLARMALISE